MKNIMKYENFNREDVYQDIKDIIISEIDDIPNSIEYDIVYRNGFFEIYIDSDGDDEFSIDDIKNLIIRLYKYSDEENDIEVSTSYYKTTYFYGKNVNTIDQLIDYMSDLKIRFKA